MGCSGPQARDLRLRRRLEHARLRRRGGGEDPRAGGKRGGDPRPVGGRGFFRRRRAHPQGDRQAAYLRVRRPRPAAPRRSEAGDGHLRKAHEGEGGPRRRGRNVPQGAARRRGSGAQAQDHRQALRGRLPAGSEEDQGRKVARAGHDLPGRHRVRGRQDQESHHHQVAPQRRRVTANPAPEAPRAVARAVQGRGQGARPRARACRARWCSAIRSPGRDWACASSAK